MPNIFKPAEKIRKATHACIPRKAYLTYSKLLNQSKTNDIAKIEKLMVNCLRTTNTNNIMECTEYLDKLPIELIEYALKKTSRTDRPSWKYAMRILDDYAEKKYTTLDQVKADELNFKSRGQPVGESEEEKRERKIRELKEAMKNDGS